MAKRLFICLLLSLLPLLRLAAQTDAPLRLELETAQDADDYHMTLMGKEGLAVFYEGEKMNADSVEWIILCYDTNLVRKTNFSVILPHPATFKSSFYNDTILYMIFQESVGKKENPRTFITRTDMVTHRSDCATIRDLPRFDVSSFKGVDDHVVFSILSGSNYYFYFFNFNKDKNEEFRIENADIISDQFVEIDSLRQRIILGLGMRFTNQIVVVAVFETDYDGNLITEAALPTQSDYYYNSLRYKQIDTSTAIIIGTYNLTSRSRSSGLYHSGVYTLLYNDSKMGEPSFYNYSQLGQKNGGGNEKEVKLDLQLLVGNIIANDSCFALITEVYYPEYSYANDYYSNSYYYNSGYNPAATTFQGYRYVNAYITCFDRNGKLLWDNYFPFNSILTRRLAKRVSLFFTPFGTAIFYPYNNYLTHTLVDGYEVIEKTSTVPVESRYKKDIIDYSRDLMMRHWYGNCFVISGYQNIRNNSKTAKGHRYVFFINKLIYE